MKKIYGIDLGTTNSVIGCDGQLISYLVSSDVDMTEERTVPHGTVGSSILSSYKVDMGLGNVSQKAIKASTIVLQSLKEEVLKQTGDVVEDVVISVPAYFSTNQRTAVQNAAKEAGLNVITLINEPTAAAIDICGTSVDKGIYAVYDLGGGTFDCTLIDSRTGKYQVIATDGRILGGDNLDYAISEFVLSKVKVPILKRTDLFMAQLKSKATECKIFMQTAYTLFKDEDSQYYEFKVPDYNDVVNITLGDYKKLVREVFGNTVTTLANLIESNVKDVSAVNLIFVGGSTHCGYLRDYVLDTIGIKVKSVSLDKAPDFTVALGVSKYAKMLQEGNADVLLEDVTKQLSIEGDTGEAIVIVPANTRIPVTKTKLVSNTRKADKLELKLYQGNHILAKKNEYIGSLVYEYPYEMEAEEGDIEVTIEIDCSGVIHFQAECLVAFGEKKEVELKCL